MPTSLFPRILLIDSPHNSRPKPASIPSLPETFPTLYTPLGTEKSHPRTSLVDLQGVNALQKLDWFQNKRINASLHQLSPLIRNTVIGRSQLNIGRQSVTLLHHLHKHMQQARNAQLLNQDPLRILLVASSQNSVEYLKGTQTNRRVVFGITDALPQ
jgi:hypothetical protein